MLIAFQTGASSQETTVYVDGKELQFKVSPIIVNGTILVPMRTILEAQGANVQWEAETRTVIAEKDKTQIIYTIGNKEATVRKFGEKSQIIPLEQPGIIQNGTTLVPLRLFSESLGNLTGWEPYTRSITITSRYAYQAEVEFHFSGDTILISPQIDESHQQIVLKLAGLTVPDDDHEKMREQLETLIPVSAKVYIEYEDEPERVDGSMSGYVYLENGTQVNAALISEGYGIVDTEAARNRWGALHQKLGQNALENARGLFATDQESSEDQLRYSPIVIKEVLAEREEMVILNRGKVNISLSNWTIRNKETGQSFTFPPHILRTGEEVRVFSGNLANVWITTGNFSHDVYVWNDSDYETTWQPDEDHDLFEVWDDHGNFTAELYDSDGNLMYVYSPE